MRSRPVFVNENGSLRLLWLSSMLFFLQFAMNSSMCSVRARPTDRNFMQLGLTCIPTRCLNCILFLVRVQAGLACCPAPRAAACAPSDGPPLAARFSFLQVCKRESALHGGSCKQIVFAENRISKCFSIRTQTGVAWSGLVATPMYVYFSEFQLAERARKHP